MENALLAQIATQLLDSYVSRVPVEQLTKTHPGPTPEDADDIQLRQAAVRVEKGARIVGHKVGLTSAPMRRAPGKSRVAWMIKSAPKIILNMRDGSIAACLASAMAGVFSSTPALAHHSYAMFDSAKEVVLTGTVQEWEWTNPHTWMVLIVPSAGTSRQWGLEGQSPGVLRMMGWNRGIVKPGDKITVQINPLRSGAPGGQILSVTAADGHVFGRPPQPK